MIAGRPERVFFLMVNHPARGATRVGNAYATRKAASSWRRFVSKARGGLSVWVEELRLRYSEDGTLHPETVRTLDERFNLDAGPVREP